MQISLDEQHACRPQGAPALATPPQLVVEPPASAVGQVQGRSTANDDWEHVEPAGQQNVPNPSVQVV
jgi:hypothetical protein